jgi:phage major head subunit gpT-like protein
MKKLFKMIKVLNGFFLCKERYNADDENVTDNNFGIGVDTRRNVGGKSYNKHIRKVWNCRGIDKKVLLTIQKDGEIHLFLL